MIALSFAILLALAEIVCRLSDRKNSRWQARVLWEGDWYSHRAASRQDALSWAACYPAAAVVHVELIYRGRLDLSQSARRNPTLKGI